MIPLCGCCQPDTIAYFPGLAIVVSSFSRLFTRQVTVFVVIITSRAGSVHVAVMGLYVRGMWWWWWGRGKGGVRLLVELVAGSCLLEQKQHSMEFPCSWGTFYFLCRLKKNLDLKTDKHTHLNTKSRSQDKHTHLHTKTCSEPSLVRPDAGVCFLGISKATVSSAASVQSIPILLPLTLPTTSPGQGTDPELSHHCLRLPSHPASTLSTLSARAAWCPKRAGWSRCSRLWTQVVLGLFHAMPHRFYY